MASGELPDDGEQLRDDWLRAAGGELIDGQWWRFSRDREAVPAGERDEVRWCWLLVPVDYRVAGGGEARRAGRVIVETHFAKPFFLTPPGCIVTRGQFRGVCRLLKFRFTEPTTEG